MCIFGVGLAYVREKEREREREREMFRVVSGLVYTPPINMTKLL
jgi:hypothetical protein